MNDEEWEDWYYDTYVAPRKEKEEAYDRYCEIEYGRIKDDRCKI